MTLFHCINLLGCKIHQMCFNNWHLDELKVSWDENAWKLIAHPHLLGVGH